jgi:hypothetical protein
LIVNAQHQELFDDDDEGTATLKLWQLVYQLSGLPTEECLVDIDVEGFTPLCKCFEEDGVTEMDCSDD